ncbi:hypothetical protein TTHT_1306 [Thermotomaculum hydrothermale]|uniref:Uncharacterized protein n=1 Tax=Thermotomaculum hydrothermale TaxID=981385 RepID=A0A7R6PFK2_9BACT|nr:hypothetical protein [Thermotomaculum hydrothermale]BBB32823.1 hypothetical protein TTHT_1306 [Thermotomaculum hydrothermale]
MRLIVLLIVVGVIGYLVYTGAGDFVGTKSNPPAKAQAQIDKTKELACRQNLKMLNDFVKTYMSTHGIDDPADVTIEQLKEYGLQIPECPAGGEYYLEDGKFYCTIHSEHKY